ncbi:hypothetical protein DPEC_G00011030 [Dallia pectoralis]|uniref:Uncharacterized protein n=1 Tax=Dallia pectoralis TaxID=75939 RepID=A0ACC2HM68_DALPE|nr:hypothetical protein DPEC_G00011030 [Dallia pectoralis]
MSKAAVRKLHWRSKVLESIIPVVGGSSGELGVAVGGGADYGEFPFVTTAPGGGLTVGDVILEIGGTPVLGMTLGDVRGVLSSCPHPIGIKTVSPGSALCKDLRLYLSKCFTPGSVDSQLQQVIRENLYLRAVPCTTRQCRDEEIPGLDYNFVSIEEFFSLEESGALLESGKFKGNYYGTPRPVHIGPECPPITYQEHCNLLRNFRIRSKSLSNLEKGAEEMENSGEDSGLSGMGHLHPPSSSPCRSRGSSGGYGSAMENILGSSSARGPATVPDNWEVAISDSGEPFYIDHHSKMTCWQDPRTHRSRDATLDRSEFLGFTDQPGELKGFSVHTRLSKGPRGFGFNIVGGSRAREFLQVYSVTPGGPGALRTADILVYINDICVLGTSHKEVVEMLKAVPVGHSVDVVLRRSYPMLYNSAGCPKQTHPGTSDVCDPLLPPTTTQPQPLYHHLSLLRPSTAPTQTQYPNLNGQPSHHSDLGYLGPGSGIDANGNATSAASQLPPSYGHFSGQRSQSTAPTPPSYRRSSGHLSDCPGYDLPLCRTSRRYQSDSSSPTPPSYRRSSGLPGDSSSPGRHSFRRSSGSTDPRTPPARPPRSLAGLAYLQAPENSLSDSEVVSAIGSCRASMVRNHNNNSLSTPPQRYRISKSDLSESDLSTSSPLPVSKLPLPHSERPHLSSSPGRGTYSCLIRPQTSLLRPPPRPSSPRFSFNGFHSNTSGSGSPSSNSSPGALSLGSEAGVGGGGELVPVALAQCESGQGMGFSVTAGGQGGRLALVKRVWDRKQCLSLQPGDAIMKINGADVQSLSVEQVQRVLQEHTRQGEVILLVHRGGSRYCSVSPNSKRRAPSPLLHTSFPPVALDSDTSVPAEVLVLPCTSPTPPLLLPAKGRSTLVQSTSFLESVPVTLTMEPKDWENVAIEVEPDRREVMVPGSVPESGGRRRVPQGFHVELRRKPGEGFGFVIASQDVENGKAASLLPHRFVTVRRGSPAAKSGQIRLGDRLEAVDGHSVVTLPHRELAHILRKAGNTLRLTIVPRPSTYSSSLSETTDYDPKNRCRKSHRSRPKNDSRYYSVDLDRGPTGFGFSLRGGSEYNMGLYVLGLMEGGPASLNNKIQVSDQLVEINGESTVGMSHSQAVQQIRRAGYRIHLVLKKGTGYVPDYGPEFRDTSSSLPQQQSKEQSVAAVDLSHQEGRSHRSKVKKRRSSSKARQRRRKDSLSGRRSSSSDTEEEKSSNSSNQGNNPLRHPLKNHDNHDADMERKTQSHGRNVRAGRERKSPAEGRVRKRQIYRMEEVDKAAEGGDDEEDEDSNRPIPNQRLPRPKQDWEEENEEEEKAKSSKETDIEEERELEGKRLRDEECDRVDRGSGKTKIINDEERGEGHGLSDWEEGMTSQSLNNLLFLESPRTSPPERSPFSFLNPSSDESESGDSHSDSSVFAASVCGPAHAQGSVLGSPGRLLPGPWLTPNSERITEVTQENRFTGDQRRRVRRPRVIEESGI